MIAKFMSAAAALIGIVASSCAPSLSAAPHLVATWPMDGAQLSVSPQNFELTFNEALAPDTTSVSVFHEDDGSPSSVDAGLDSQDPRRIKVRLLDPSEGGYQMRWHATAAAGGQVSEGEQTFRLRGESPAPPRLDVSPPQVEIGDRLELVGKGFSPNSSVQLSIGDDGQALQSADTDARGGLNVELRLPDSVPFGLQPLTGVDSHGLRATVALGVRWGGWPPAVATDVGQPGPGPNQVTFVVQPRNRSDYVLEHVSVVMQDPDGSTLIDSTPDAEHKNGTLTWMIPVMPRGLFGPYRATYQTSAAVVSHSWMEFRHRHERGCVGGTCMPAFISVSTADSLPVGPAPAQ